MLIVAADHAHDLQHKVRALTHAVSFKAGVEILLDQAGRTRPDLPGHEHFGFKDGVSQRGVRGVDPPDDPIGNPDQGHPGQDLLWPGEFVLGYATQNPPRNPAWTDPIPIPVPTANRVRLGLPTAPISCSADWVRTFPHSSLT